MVKFGMDGRVVVVTGGASGIGRATAQLAMANGARVAVLDVNEDAVLQTVTECRDSGGQAWGYAVDVRDGARIHQIVDQVEDEIGEIDGVVAAAGVARHQSVVDTSEAEFADVVGINLMGVFHTAHATGERMLSRGRGSFVAIGSTDSFGGHDGRSSYAASKHGLVGLVKTLAIEWGPRGVRANLVAPGPVDTPALRRLNDDAAMRRDFLSKIPLQRLSTSAEQAAASVFLLSDASSFITGVALPVDGGVTAGYFNNFGA